MPHESPTHRAANSRNPAYRFKPVFIPTWRFVSYGLANGQGMKMTTTTHPMQNQSRYGDYTGSKILVIDDDVTITKIVETYLGKAGFEKVTSVTDSRKAIEAVKEYSPDMVLLDIFMPDVDGLEILKRIRANSLFDKTVVLMLSSAGKEERFQSLEMGAMGFIQKPVTGQELIEEVGKAFRVAAKFGAF